MIKTNSQSSSGAFSPILNGDGNNVSINTMRYRVANEVKTIQTIIATLTRLSKEMGDGVVGEQSRIGPEHKISKRFASYRSTLEQLYADLTLRYSEPYESVMEELTISRIDSECVASYLRRKSISILEKNNNNPITALDELVRTLEQQFYYLEEADFQYDDGAVCYFIYNELVKCNVFPNPQHENE